MDTALAMTAFAIGGFAIEVEGETIAFRPSPGLAVTGAIVSLAGGVAAGLELAIQAATVPIVNALRQV